MKRQFAVFVVIACLCFFACSTEDKPEAVEGDALETGVTFQKLSLDDALVSAKNQNKLVMIDFFSPT